MLTSDKQSISAGGYGLAELAEVDLSGPRKLLENVTITVLCDVTNSLLGEHGATKVFARQKGATEEMIQNLEEAMENYAEIMDRDCGVDFSTWKGTGAAGGLGYGLLCVSNARFENGCSYIAKALGVEDKIKTCDYVITGEGFIDNQSLNGKVPVGIANIAKLYGKPVIVFAGGRSGSQESFYEQGITSVFTILPGRMNMDELLRTGKDNLTFTAENFMRLLVTEQNRINANNI
jgi:glycerate kinase